MNHLNKYKKELESLSSANGNDKCFDCDSQPAHWASIYNGIYLCEQCSQEHRKFGSQISYIRVITYDEWNEEQIKLMRVGGNLRLKNFMAENDMPIDISKKDFYSSKIMSYYRKMLRAESNGKYIDEPLPDGNIWEPITVNNNSQDNNLFSGTKYNSSSRLMNNNNLAIANSRLNDCINNENPNFDNQNPEIIISEDHYKQARNDSEHQSIETSNEPKFKKFQDSYKNDIRYSSVNSELLDVHSSSDTNNPNDNIENNNGNQSRLGSFVGKIWTSSVNTASFIKEKMQQYEVGNKLITIGGKAVHIIYVAGDKTVRVIYYAGGKIIEKSNGLVVTEAVKNLFSKAGEGISYLKNKFFGGNNESPTASYSQKFDLGDNYPNIDD